MKALYVGSLAALAVLAAPAAADVITVGIFGADFTSINSAVLAAVDGDTIVVHPGTYGPFTVGGNKSLTITSDGQPGVYVAGPIGVLNGAAGRTFVFSGLTSQGNVGSDTPFQGFGLWAVNTASAIRAQDCSFRGANGDPDGWGASGLSFKVTGHAAGWHGVYLQNCTGSVALNDCTITGGSGPDMTTFPDPDCGCSYGEPGGDGVHVENSIVSLADCDVVAGWGASADRVGGAGGSGVKVLSGTAVVSGGSWEGGDGGGAWDYIGSVFGGPGGHGIAAATGATVWVRDTLALGGAGGDSLTGDYGAPGSPIAGPATLYSGEARSLAVAAPALVGFSNTMTLTGQPGDFAMLFVSLSPGLVPSAKFGGQLLVGGSPLVVALGSVPPSGQLVITTNPVPWIGPLVELPVFLQGLLGVPGDAAFTGAATLIMVYPGAL